MKRVFKFIRSFLFVLVFGIMILPHNVMASNFRHEIVKEQKMPRADITGWRYKKINGKLHRRLYNYSKEAWIGEWELYQ